MGTNQGPSDTELSMQLKDQLKLSACQLMGCFDDRFLCEIWHTPKVQIIGAVGGAGVTKPLLFPSTYFMNQYIFLKLTLKLGEKKMLNSGSSQQE